MKVLLKTPLMTRKLAASIATSCVLGTIIYLEGGLGVGKTTFVRGFLRGLGYPKHVQSPTFKLLEIYRIKNLTLCHFDLYRLTDPKELEYIGAADYFTEDNICLIEWPACGKGFLPQPDLRCKLDFAAAGKYREIEIIAGSYKGEIVLARIKN